MADKRKKPVTRGEVARAAGVSEATVSMALRGLRKVRPSTRERVRAVAERLGYEPNPVASLLAHQRHRGTQERLRVVQLAEVIYDEAAAQEAFNAAGMDLTWRRPSEFATPEAASRQLWHEGFSGLMISLDRSKWTAAETLCFDWSKFSVVKTSRGSSPLPFHLVRHSPFDYMEETIRHVVEAGHRRIAMVLGRSSSERDDDARYGALLNWQARKMPTGVELRWREVPGADLSIDAGALRWLRDEPVDAIILYHWAMIYSLLEAGWRIPEEAAIAAVLSKQQSYDGIPLVTGCNVQEVQIYERAAGMLREQILRGERGFPAHANEQVIEPLWIEGETLPTR